MDLQNKNNPGVNTDICYVDYWKLDVLMDRLFELLHIWFITQGLCTPLVGERNVKYGGGSVMVWGSLARSRDFHRWQPDLTETADPLLAEYVFKYHINIPYLANYSS